MRYTNKEKGLFLGVVVFILSLLHPITRPLIMWLLPLGSGPDDLLVIAFIVLFILFWKGIGK